MPARLRFGFLVVALSFGFAALLAAQATQSGRVAHGHVSAKTAAPTGTYTVNFPPTPVGYFSVQDCYYNCFYTGSGTCNYSGTISLVESVAAPFMVAHLRKGTVSGGCDGTPVNLPVTLQAGEWLLQDFVFSPTKTGTFQDSQVYSVTPTGSPSDTSTWSLVGSTPPPAISSFAATPPTIRAGQSAVLTFTTLYATSVIIDNGVGSQLTSGAVTVSPTSTTTYTLTATSSLGTATSSVTVNVITAPSVAVSSFPSAIVQAQGSGGGTTRYVLTNAGGGSTSITLTQTGTFFTQSPSSFTLGPGASQTVTITGTAQAAGAFNGGSFPSGSGVPSGLGIPINLLSTAPPSAPVSAAPTSNRVDLAGSAGTISTGSVSFTNSGAGTLTGILSADVPWIVPQSGVVSIPPNSTASFTFTIDRSKRGDASAPAGSLTGRISLVYLSGSLGKRGVALDNTTPSVSLVSVVDTVQPSVTTAVAPALGSGEVALFVPGVGHVQGSVGLFISDLSILNPPGNHAVSDLRFYYAPIGGGAADQKSATMPSITTVNVAVADVVKNVFGVSQLGTLQLRSADAAKLGVGAAISVVDRPSGTFGNSIPVFRSDRGIGNGGALVLSGIQKTATSHTNIFIQETSGAGPVTVSTQFLAADGTSLGTGTDAIGAFALGLVATPVPAGATAAIMTNTGATAGSFLAYATPVDELSGDTWTVADWAAQYGYSHSASIVVPVAGVVHGANDTFFRTDLAITNSGSSNGTGTLQFVSQSGTTTSTTIALASHQSRIISDVVGTLFNITSDVGYLIFTPSNGAFAMTSRTYTTSPTQPGTFGFGVPVLAQASTLQLGSIRAIGSIDDAARATVIAQRPATFRTNYGLVETSGNPATVLVTLRFQYPAGQYTTAVGTASKQYALGPHQFILINGLSADILGTARDTLGDLRGLEVDFQVISGTGTVAVFTSSVDNGSGDSTLRTD